MGMMEDGAESTSDGGLERLIQPYEQIHVHARAAGATVAVTNRRLIVARRDRLDLAIPFERLRRVQFDIERARPATLVVVPDDPGDEPQVLAISPEEYDGAARILVQIGANLAGMGPGAASAEAAERD